MSVSNLIIAPAREKSTVSIGQGAYSDGETAYTHFS